MDIEGNDRADEMAKEATDLKPTIENTTWQSFTGSYGKA